MSPKMSLAECTLPLRLPISPTNACSKHIQFSPFTPKDIVRISEVEVSLPDLYKIHENGDRTTAPNGPLDGRMGPNEKGKQCLTCGEQAVACVGHYGYIRLVLPVFHIGYFRPTINMLSCVCKVSSEHIDNTCPELTAVELRTYSLARSRSNSLPQKVPQFRTRISPETNRSEGCPLDLQKDHPLPPLRCRQWCR